MKNIDRQVQEMIEKGKKEFSAHQPEWMKNVEREIYSYNEKTKKIMSDIPRFIAILEDISKKRNNAINLYEEKKGDHGAKQTALAQLKWCLRNERRVFVVLKDGTDHAIDVIKTCNKFLKSSDVKGFFYTEHNDDVNYVRNAIEDALDTLKVFFAFTKDRVKKMEKRQELEERFLEYGDEVHFNKFLEVWKKEVNDAKDFGKQLSKQRGIKNFVGRAAVGSGLSAGLFGTIGAITGGSRPVFVALFASLGILFGLALAVGSCFAATNEESEAELGKLKQFGISFGFFGGLKQKLV